MRAALFLGSGISRASGAPMVDDITDSLLNGAWWYHTDLRFYPGQQTRRFESVDIAKNAQCFLKILKEVTDCHLIQNDNRRSNYEDLYAAAKQIVQDETGEILNPLIAPSVALIKEKAQYLYEGLDDHNFSHFVSLADKATDLIQWVVYNGLSSVTTPKGLGLISEIARSTSEFDIFTLNHDLLVEAELQKNQITFADGFSEEIGDITAYNASWQRNDAPVRLYKLHGSINWYLFRFKNKGFAIDRCAKAENISPDYCKDDTGNLMDITQVSPSFLTGTTVKEQSYGYGLFGELFTYFRERLSKYQTLICSGYGWGDKGVNIRLDQWLSDGIDNKIIILHNAPEEELRYKRFWANRWAR